jgi:hypothetical protein
MVLRKIDSCPTRSCSLLKVLSQNLKFKILSNRFCFEFLNIHMNEKKELTMITMALNDKI